MNILANVDDERGLLAGLIKYGGVAYHNISDLDISSATFTIESHKVIFRCLYYIFYHQDNAVIDIPSIYSAASSLGLRSWFQNDTEVKYLNAIINLPIQEENVRPFTLRIKKLEIGRLMFERLEQAKDDTLNITGNRKNNIKLWFILIY